MTRLIFFGTPDFSVPALLALVKAGYEIVAVITQPDKPVGRGLKMEAPPVKIKAEELGLRVLQPETLKSSVAEGFSLPNGGLKASATSAIEILRALHADVSVCVAYGKIIPKEILDLFPKGILNIHPSLLPKYRGPSPIQTAILNGDSETGVTIMLLDEEMDHGPILAQHTVIISPSPGLRPPSPRGRGVGGEGYTGGELSQILVRNGTELLLETLPKWLADEIQPRPQEHAKATFTKMLEREDGRIDWQKSAEQIERMVRAYDMWPGTWTTYQNKRLKVLRTLLFHATIGCASNAAPGYVWKTDDGRLAVNCNPGAIILEELQLEGKKAMSMQDFLHGYPKFLTAVFK